MGRESPELSERAQYLLKVLVERYISDGEPVGSRSLARASGLDLSPATVRNVMADLEEFGLITAPHTSAGRVPTVKGYRFFVDSLVTVKPLRARDLKSIESQIGKDRSPQELVSSASDLLSSVTQMAGIVTVPRREHITLRHIEFLPLNENRVLAILVVNEAEVQNRIIHPKRPYSQADLQQAANYLNTHFAGRDVYEIREGLVRELKEARKNVNAMMAEVVDVADKLFPEESSEDYVMTGQANLFRADMAEDMDKLRQLFEIFSEKRDILQVLDQCLYSDGVQIFIGSETGNAVLDDCSLVTSSYRVDDEVVGVLGVIGPTRMAYERVIPVVDITARLVGAALEFKE